MKRRFVATIEWLRLFPNDGFLPQTAQTLDIGRGSVAANGATVSARRGAELREDVGHLERRCGPPRRPSRSASSACSRVVEREDAERDGHARLERGELEAARGLARDEVEVRRVAADDAAESDDAGVAAGLRERHRRERQLEGAGHRHDRDRIAGTPAALERAERALEQPVRDVAVEAGDDDADRAAGPLGSPSSTP